MGDALEIERIENDDGLNESIVFNKSICFEYNLTYLNELNVTENCGEFFVNPLPMGLMTVIQIFYALVCIVGLCGNTLVIYVVLRYSKMQTVTNMYILNLALADECFLVGIPFLIVTSYLGDWPFGMEMCKIYLTTTSINQFTSSIFLTVMSMDRYIAVCHPISSPRYRTAVIARCVSLTAWAASALLMVPVFMYAATITKPSGGQSCNIFWPFEDKNGTELNETTTFRMEAPSFLNGQTAFTFYSFVLGFAIPLILIMIFYVLVIVKLKTVGPKNKSKEKKKSHRKVTRLVLTVITVYILCWLPYWITQLALIFTPPGHNQDNVVVAVMLLAGCLSYSNSAMNPVLYAFLSENFKKSFMKACTCANGRDVNAALHVEHSMFPRKRNRRNLSAKNNQPGTATGAANLSTANGSKKSDLANHLTNGNPPTNNSREENHELDDVTMTSNHQGNELSCSSSNVRYDTTRFIPSTTSGAQITTTTSLINDETSDDTPIVIDPPSYNQLQQNEETHVNETTPIQYSK